METNENQPSSEVSQETQEEDGEEGLHVTARAGRGDRQGKTGNDGHRHRHAHRRPSQIRLRLLRRNVKRGHPTVPLILFVPIEGFL